MSKRAEMRRQQRSKEKSDSGKIGRRVGGGILIVLALLFFGSILSDVFFPFQGQEYVPISHGDHEHYVPQDRNPDVPVGNFPTQPPGPGQRILPNGQVVSE